LGRIINQIASKSNTPSWILSEDEDNEEPLQDKK
jgi:hypothetical protein